MSAGIDYGMGVTNRDLETGIRYGVIPINRLSGDAMSDAEGIYSETVEVECPNCNTIIETTNNDGTICDHCGHEFRFEYNPFEQQEPIGYDYTPNDPEYTTESDETDIFITKSPYYTRANFCSPCAPGACYLPSPNPEGEKCFCLGADFFDEFNPCPYPIYRIDNDELVQEAQGE